MPALPPDAPARAVPPEERERQRFRHLVLGEPRPKPSGGRRGKRRAPPPLAPGIEERVALRETWRGLEGTPETREHASRAATRPGSLQRLRTSGAIDVHQHAAAIEIETAHRALTAEVAVRTAKLEPRGTGGGPDAAAAERIGAVLRERDYSRWRRRMGTDAPLVLAIVVEDLALSEAARRCRMSVRRARAILLRGLDAWRR